jgi:hypothetical protein
MALDQVLTVASLTATVIAAIAGVIAAILAVRADSTRCCQGSVRTPVPGQKRINARVKFVGSPIRFVFGNWRRRDGNDPSVDIAKDANQRF